MKNCTVRATLNQRVAMRDGVGLSTNIYLPDSPGPFPVLLIRTPYDASGKNSGVLEWPSRGFAYVVQDARGRFLSDGEWYPWFNEKDDGEDTLNWIAAQPWCNGNIAMYGGSYLSSTQLAAALTGHPNLKCLTPCLKGCDFYHTAYWGGALKLAWQSSWTTPITQVDGVEPVRDHLPLADLDVFAGGKPVPYWQDLLRHPRLDEFWKPVTLSQNFEKISAPMFIRTGWFDLFVGDVFNLYNGVREHGGNETVRKQSRILVGPWPHNINQQLVGEEDFGESAVISDLYEKEIAFIERFTDAKTIEENSNAPIRLFVMGANKWRDEYAWPLTRTVWTEYFLGSGGTANSASGDGVLGAAPSGLSDRFDYDPSHPVPTKGGAWEFANVGPCDQSEIEAREDVLVYTSEVLADDLEVTGPVEVKLFASSSARDTDFTAKLVDVRLDGKAMSVTDGIVRARYRNASEGEELLVPGEVYEFTIHCNPTSYLFRKGHRLRVEIASSNFPAFARNLNSGGDIASETEMHIAHQTVYHNDQFPSRIILPVIPEKL
jgi:putative CocE/NonD family hydrolase